MSILDVSQMWSRDNPSWQISDDRKTRTYAAKEAYQILATADTTKEEIYAANGLPKPGMVLSGTVSVFVKKVTAIRVSPILWIADVEYGGEHGPRGPEDSPLNAPPEITWSDVETDEPIDTDADGNAIVTANGEPIYGVTMKVPDPVVTIVRNFRTFNPFSTARYRQSVSSDWFLGFPPGTARLTKYQAQQIYDDRGSYWKITGTIQFRLAVHTTNEFAWHARVRHEGLYEKLADGKIVRAVDRFGEFVTKPVLLKSDGTRENDINNAYWLLFRRYQPLPYRALGLI